MIYVCALLNVQIEICYHSSSLEFAPQTFSVFNLCTDFHLRIILICHLRFSRWTHRHIAWHCIRFLWIRTKFWTYLAHSVCLIVIRLIQRNWIALKLNNALVRLMLKCRCKFWMHRIKFDAIEVNVRRYMCVLKKQIIGFKPPKFQKLMQYVRLFSAFDSWMRLGFQVDARGCVPVKVVARTFASGKTEKMVYQCLSELGLPCGKNDTMEKSEFTFDKFYALYHKICPRNDIEDLFRSM